MAESTNALDLLRRDHQLVQRLFEQLEKAEAEKEQRELCEQIAGQLTQHAEVEEKVFYPYLREATGRDDLFHKAALEHEIARTLLERLPKEKQGTAEMRALVLVLKEQVQHHVEQEEAELFTQVERTGVDLIALGEALLDSREGRSPMGEKAGSGKDKGKGSSKGKEARGADRAKDSGKDGEESAEQAAREDKEFLDENAEGLSRTAQRAKWVQTPGEGPDRDGQTLATRRIEVVQAWAEARKARPATTPGGDTERPRVLRLDFPDYDDRLEEVSWEAWGSVFEERQLVFLYQETMSSGKQSNFFQLDSPEREDG
jgi:hemerythrin superfamily protein